MEKKCEGGCLNLFQICVCFKLVYASCISVEFLSGFVTTHVHNTSAEQGRREVGRRNRKMNLRVTGPDWMV